MRKKYSLLGWKQQVSALIAGLFLFLAAADTSAQNPELPILRLIAEAPTSLGNNTFHPDRRMYSPRSEDGKKNREILVPVLVKNCWETKLDVAQVEAIKSFTIKMQYDGRALKAVGIQKVGPRPEDTYSLAANFRLDWEDTEDTTYKASLGSLPEPDGRRIRITGTSSDSLPLSPAIGGISNPECRDRQFVEMFYIRFEVLAQPSTVSENSPLIITNDTLIWNDRNVTERQFPDDPFPDEFEGLDGINNSNTPDFDDNEATRPGVLYLVVTQIPEIGFSPTQGANAVVEEVPNTDRAEWRLINAMTIDSMAVDHGAFENVTRRRLDVINLVPSTRLTDIKVESDQPWLRFWTVSLDKNPIPRETRKGLIDMIDNNILGGLDPLGNPTDPDPTLVMEIVCDADALQETNSPAGVYTGYITFTSESALVSPVRLRVTFVMYRNPIEPNTETDINEQFTTGRGIEILVENSGDPVEQTNLIFGIGVRGRTVIDPLFGETEATEPLDGFGARWFPKDENGVDVALNGLGDLTGRSSSLDVRDAINNENTISFICRFNAGGEDKYPVVLTWDVRDFPDGAELFLRDTINGGLFSTNMRKATRVPGQASLFTFTIEDARINSFLIEYSPPTTVRIPELNSGWNLVSLPVFPGSNFYRDVYTNALEAPQFYSANSYQVEPLGELRFGVGYFLKYGAVLDEFIAGVTVNRIGEGTRHEVIVQEGWNTIGALSTVVDVNQIQFRSYQGEPVPERAGGIYRYLTDRGYEEVNALQTGIGYWMAIESADPDDIAVGILEVALTKAAATTSPLSERDQVIAVSKEVLVSDVAGREGRVYIAPTDHQMNMKRFNLPPVPYADMFDVRFASDRYIDNVDDPFLIVSGADYPVSITVADPFATYAVINAVTGENLGVIENGGDVKISDERIKAIKLEKTSVAAATFSLQPNKPNPASSTTAFEFSVPEKSFVTISVYNTLGQEIATLGNAEYVAGVHTILFDVSDLQSGSYIYKLTAGDFAATRSLTVVK